MLTRFAPSPTGYLHLGHALAAKQAFEYGPCLLRIEDIDHTRCKPEYIDAIYENLSWLGFDWPQPVRVQSEHYGDYKSVIMQLFERHLIYRCFKTRKDLAGNPPSRLNRKDEAEMRAKRLPYAWRLDIHSCRRYGPLSYDDNGETKTVDLTTLEDIVVARKDIGTSYHIAVTHDDALQGITHVVRGADFIDQTPYHVLLQRLMKWPTPVYHHHELVMGDDDKKLSKSNKDITIRSLREKGLSPQDVFDMAESGLAG